MPTSPVPIRGLGSVGIITDLSPNDAPINAWTSGNNVRFTSGKAQRTPIFREVPTGLTSGSISFIFGARKPSSDYSVLCMKDGSLWKWQDEVAAELTPVDYTPSDGEPNWTSSHLGNVLYINRPTQVPYGLRSTDTRFTTITGWDSTWRCKALRAFSNVLVALNVTKGPNDYPQMVKWSDIAQAGSFPSSWDITDTTKRAGENILTDLRTPLVDGCKLGELFFLYASDEVWVMQFIGGRNFFSFKRRFEGHGCLAPNCVVEAEGWHYVFGPYDIYRHNGSQIESLVSDKVQVDLFTSLITEGTTVKPFVVHDQRRQDIIFAYPSGHPHCNFKSTTGCNRALVYNYRVGTLGFMDLPNLVSADLINLSKSLTYASASAFSYASTGGTFYSVSGGTALRYVAAVSPDSHSSIYALDGANIDSTLPYQMSPMNKPAWLERVGVDLDELLPDIAGYKRLVSLHPQVKSKAIGGTVLFRLGASMFSADNPSWGPAQSLNPNSQFKVDGRGGGRYIGYRLETPDFNDFELTGLTLHVAVTGRRA